MKLLMKVPREIYIAVSGGPDSMAIVDFLKRSHQVKLLHFNHGTKHGEIAEKFVRNYANQNNLEIHIGIINSACPKNKSQEEFWREERYKFFDKFNGPIVMGHNLDDAVETWIMTCLCGEGRIIPSVRGKYIRPFLICKKQELLDWCINKCVDFVIDEGNEDNKFNRVKVRKLMPKLLEVNSGLYKVVKKKYLR